MHSPSNLQLESTCNVLIFALLVTFPLYLSLAHLTTALFVHAIKYSKPTYIIFMQSHLWSRSHTAGNSDIEVVIEAIARGSNWHQFPNQNKQSSPSLYLLFRYQ